MEKESAKYVTRTVTKPKYVVKTTPTKKTRVVSPTTKTVSTPAAPGIGRGRNVRQDESLPVLLDLLNEGYNVVTWKIHPNACNMCKAKGLNGRKMLLSDMVKGLSFSAPIFERLHVNSKSSVIVSGQNKQNIEVNSEGIK